MAWIWTIVLAVVAAFGGHALGQRLHARASEPAPELATDELVTLRAAVERAETRRTELAAELRRAPQPSTSAPSEGAGPDDAELAAALARWRAANPAEVERLSAARTAPAPTLEGERDLATLPIEVLVRELGDADFGDDARQALFQKLRDLGRIDEYVAAMERRAAADPDDPALQIALGQAYLQKLFGMGASPEVGTLAMQADRAFDRALELEPGNWNARFTKAVALSNWPAFLGRGPEAIDQFEQLIEAQAGLPPEPHFAYPYLFLGNMHQASGELPKAIAIWKAGLQSYPDDPGLLAALKAAGL